MLDTMNHGGRIAMLGIPPSDMSIDWTKVIFKGLFIKVYTFFLTDRGGEMLREMNDAAVSVKLNNKVGFSLGRSSKLDAGTTCQRLR